MASDSVATEPQSARKLARASYIVSTIGIVVTIIIVSVIFGIFYGSCRYYVNGVCYHYASEDYSYYQCSRINGFYYDGVCYYN